MCGLIITKKFVFSIIFLFIFITHMITLMVFNAWCFWWRCKINCTACVLDGTVTFGNLLVFHCRFMWHLKESKESRLKIITKRRIIIINKQPQQKISRELTVIHIFGYFAWTINLAKNYNRIKYIFYQTRL